MRGDANCNGELAAADLPAVVTALFERGPCADADVNGDGAKNASDVTAELRLLNGGIQESAFDKVLDEIQPDGTMTLDTARQLFQLAYGGLDGVTVPTGTVEGDVDGTIALHAMLEHRDDLSAADAARLDEVLDVNGPVSTTIQSSLTSPTSLPSAERRTLAASADALPTPLPSDNADVQDFFNRIIVWLPEIADAAQVLFTLRIDIAVYPGSLAAMPNAVADTLTFDTNGGGGEPVSCRIRFFQGAINSMPSARDNTVAHELWHCFEALIVGDRDTAFGESDWIIEGQAEYVGVYITKTRSGSFYKYLSLPSFPLFGRAYSAVGFYVTMENDGTDMFPALKTMLLTGPESNELAFDFAQSATPRLLDTWGEREFENTTHGGDWDYLIATGLPPPADDTIPGAVHLDMDDGALELVQVPTYTVFLWKVNLTTDFIHFQIQGPARALDEAGNEFDDLFDLWLCAHDDPQECKCPDGSEGMAPESQPVSGLIEVAANAGDSAVNGTMTSISLDQICKQKPPPTPSPFCADARGLQHSINQFAGRGLDPAILQAELQADVHWLGLMAQDAPADIVGAMKPVADAYVTANADFASIGYAVVPMSEEDELMIQAALNAVIAVGPQAQQVGAYVVKVCGFQFAINGV